MSRYGINSFRPLITSFFCNGPRGSVYTHQRPSVQARHLYTPAAIGLDHYESLRHSTSVRFANIVEGFKERMRELLAKQDKALVFTEDFKNILHLAEAKEEDLALIRNMAHRFNKQHEGLRFGMYVFGPVVMRTYHSLNQPQEALEALRDPQLTGFFDQLISYQVAMDLLYKAGRYEDVLKVFEEVQERRITGARYPKNCLNIAIASCYKMNTQESMLHLQELLSKMEEYGISYNRKVLVFSASLALSLGHPHTALDLILQSNAVTHITIRSIKVMSLSQLGRVEEAMRVLRSIAEIDIPVPSGSKQRLYIIREAVNAVEKAVNEGGKKDQEVELSRIIKYLDEMKAVSEETLDDLACQHIDKFERHTRQDKAMLEASFHRPHREARNRNPSRRQGLMEME